MLNFKKFYCCHQWYKRQSREHVVTTINQYGYATQKYERMPMMFVFMKKFSRNFNY